MNDENEIEDRPLVRWLMAYLLGAMLTGSYVVEYRWSDWATNDIMGQERAAVATTVATLAWPAYIGGCCTRWVYRAIEREWNADDCRTFEPTPECDE